MRSTQVLPLLLVLAFSARLTYAQCPAIGNASNCGTVITITDDSAYISNTGQGTYGTPNENNDFTPTGTLVGVINNSSQPIQSLELTGPSIFAFEYDGIDVYGTPGNSADSTGYGGPNAYFTNIVNFLSDGVVTFVTPIPPGGGTSYFSLAVPLASGSKCASLLTGALSVYTAGTSINASFTNTYGYNLTDAAAVCGFTNFDWQQLITILPAPSPFYDASGNNLLAPAPFNDPPPNGYAYQAPPNAVQLPVYYNLFTGSSDKLSLAYNEVGNTLYFFDAPANPCLPGGNYSGFCNGSDPAGSYLAFSTHLVGIVGDPSNASVQDTGIGFSWTDNFNGTVGGIAVLNGTRPVDPGSGTGGITLTAVNKIPTYQYPKGLVVKKVNSQLISPPAPLTLLTHSQLATVATPELYIPKTKTFDGIVVIRNTSTTTLEGPFQLVLYSLTNGVKLVNATGAFGTAPFYTIPGVSKLNPGEFAFAIVEFSDPSSAKIKFSPALYTGGFN